MTEMKEKIRKYPSAPDIELTEMRNEGAHSYRLKVITDVQKYLEEEITRRENFSKKYFRISRVINSVDSVLISISLGAGITGAVLLSTVVAAPVVLGLEISAGAIGLISLIGNVVSKKTAIKAEKHLKIKMLASAKLDTIKTHVSKALVDDSSIKRPVLGQLIKTKFTPSLSHISFNAFINNPVLYENLYFLIHITP